MLRSQRRQLAQPMALQPEHQEPDCQIETGGHDERYADRGYAMPDDLAPIHWFSLRPKDLKLLTPPLSKLFQTKGSCYLAAIKMRRPSPTTLHKHGNVSVGALGLLITDLAGTRTRGGEPIDRPAPSELDNCHSNFRRAQRPPRKANGPRRG